MADDRDELIGDVLVSADEVRERIAELGKEIAADYEGKNPLLVAVLKGAFIFMADLARAVEEPLEVDFMAVSSASSRTSTSISPTATSSSSRTSSTRV